MTSGCVRSSWSHSCELVDGEVGLHAGDVLERLDAVVAQRDHALVGGVGRPVQADTGGAARRARSPSASNAAARPCRARPARSRRTATRAEDSSAPRPDAVLAVQHRSDRGEFVGRQRIKGVRHPSLRSHRRRCRSAIRRDSSPASVVPPARSPPTPVGGRRWGRIRGGSAGRTPSPPARSAVYRGQPSPGTPVRLNARHRVCTSSADPPRRATVGGGGQQRPEPGAVDVEDREQFGGVGGAEPRPAEACAARSRTGTRRSAHAGRAPRRSAMPRCRRRSRRRAGCRRSDSGSPDRPR